MNAVSTAIDAFLALEQTIIDGWHVTVQEQYRKTRGSRIATILREFVAAPKKGSLDLASHTGKNGRDLPHLCLASMHAALVTESKPYRALEVLQLIDSSSVVQLKSELRETSSAVKSHGEVFGGCSPEHKITKHLVAFVAAGGQYLEPPDKQTTGTSWQQVEEIQSGTIWPGDSHQKPGLAQEPSVAEIWKRDPTCFAGQMQLILVKVATGDNHDGMCLVWHPLTPVCDPESVSLSDLTNGKYNKSAISDHRHKGWTKAGKSADNQYSDHIKSAWTKVWESAAEPISNTSFSRAARH